MTTINTLLALHNDLAPTHMTLKSWKRSKADLQARIERLKPARGAIGNAVTELVANTSMAYDAIEHLIRGTYPNARTSRRSIASVAAELRRSGVAVPYRRKPSKVENGGAKLGHGSGGIGLLRAV
jgi:hypothetical protein